VHSMRQYESFRFNKQFAPHRYTAKLFPKRLSERDNRQSQGSRRVL
jgi:hypothetical protein